MGENGSQFRHAEGWRVRQINQHSAGLIGLDSGETKMHSTARKTAASQTIDGNTLPSDALRFGIDREGRTLVMGTNY